MHYYKFNIGDYASHTRHLSPIEDIAYRRLLDLAYTTEKPIIKDIRDLSRLINLREYPQEIIDVLKDFWEEVEEGWINNRVFKEIESTGVKSESASKSAKMRWDKIKKANAMREECERNANALKNDALVCENDATHYPLPITHYPLPETHYPDTKVKDLPARKKRAAPKNDDDDTEALQSACKLTWAAYRTAYALRYAIDPVRNAKVNGQIKMLVGRLGLSDSPLVAAHYLTCNSAYYVQRGHNLDSLLADAEKLRTEWATGRSMTSTRARQIDQTQANMGIVSEAMEILERMGHEKNT